MVAADDRRREFRRLLGISAAAHVALVLALSYTPRSGPVMLPGVISVDLVAPPSAAPPAKAPPQAARPAPAPTPVPKPAPTPKPKPKQVVLPEKPIQPPVPAKKPQPRPKPAPAATPPPEPAAEPAPEKDLTDVLADLRSEVGEDTTPDAPASAAPALGRGRPVTPEVAAWLKRAKLHVRQNWVVPPGFRTQPLQTHVVIELGPGGEVIGEPRITRRSGNPWYDEGVTRAIKKASPLPPPPDAGDWTLVFVPEDSF